MDLVFDDRVDLGGAVGQANVGLKAMALIASACRVVAASTTPMGSRRLVATEVTFYRGVGELASELGQGVMSILIAGFRELSIRTSISPFDVGDEVTGVHGRPPVLGGPDELKVMASPLPCPPGPLVTLAGGRTVAKVDSIGLVVVK